MANASYVEPHIEKMKRLNHVIATDHLWEEACYIDFSKANKSPRESKSYIPCGRHSKRKCPFFRESNDNLQTLRKELLGILRRYIQACYHTLGVSSLNTPRSFSDHTYFTTLHFYSDTYVRIIAVFVFEKLTMSDT